MADFVEIRTRGFRELEKAFRQLPKKVGRRILLNALRAGAKPVIEAARANAPVETGRLRDSIIARTVRAGGPEEARIDVGPSSDVFYGHLVEFGTGPHLIEAKNAEALAVRGGPPVKSVNHPGAAPRPFLRPAFDETAAAAERIVGEKLAQGIERAFKRLGKA